jgi:hypothetical protein
MESKGKLAFLVLGALLAGSLFTAGPASAGKAKVEILRADQTSATGKGLRVLVRARNGTSLSLTAFSRTFDDGTNRASRPVRVRIGASGRRTVQIRLVAGARKAARECGERTFIVRAGRGASGSARGSMTRNRSACRARPLALDRAEECDFIALPDRGNCMFPFPNDFYTRPDQSSPTGKRIDFPEGAMPTNTAERPIDPADYAASDGFSHGQPIVLKVPGLDSDQAITRNGFVGLEDLGRYSGRNQKAVVVEVATGKRWPIWVQVDANASTDADRALIISPAVNFEPKRRYVVALRNLVSATGRKIEAPAGFRVLRDRLPSRQAQVNQRRAAYEGIFRTLRKAKVRRSNLYLAWDFTTSSNENNYERALSMRDRAFAELGDENLSDGIVEGDAPAFNVTQVTDGGSNPDIGRRVRGSFTVPCFLEPNCAPAGEMVLDESGLPTRNGDWQANFDCIIPTSGLAPGAEPLRPYLYGHGLVGTASQVTGGVNPPLAEEYGMLACATDEIGMSSSDLAAIASALQELSAFNQVPDRLQQGVLNSLFLARLLIHPEGFASHPAFQNGDGSSAGDSLIAPNEVYWVGASQGGIFGGPFTALSPDVTRAAMVVGAMNYSTLLVRSSDWPEYGEIMYFFYPDELERPLIFSLIQMLWDRGEPNGYSHVMTDDPPPDTPAHTVSMHIALGDHQVSNFASDVQARTIQAATNANPVDPRRWPGYQALWGIERLAAEQFPYSGNSIIYWDGGPVRPDPLDPGGLIGTGVPPYANVPPDPEWEDPHGAPRGASGPIEMMSTFLQQDGFIDATAICDSDPCLGDGWDGDYSALP